MTQTKSCNQKTPLLLWSHVFRKKKDNPPPKKKMLNNDGEAIVILLAANNWLSSNVSVSIHVKIDNIRDNVGNSHVDKTKAYCMPSKRDIKSIM